MSLKQVLKIVLFVLALFALGWLYVAGVASLSDLVACHLGGELFSGSAEHLPDGEWELAAETDHFVYYTRSDDTIPRWATEVHETVLAEVSGILDITVANKIRYLKYPSPLDLYRATGQRSTGVTRAGDEGIEIHSTQRYDPHEVAHAAVHQQWEPPAFFDEGLATAYGWDWDVPEADVHVHAYKLLQEERLLPVASILTNWDFHLYRTYPAYSTAGSFVKYLLDVRDPQAIRPLLQLEKFSQRQELEAAFLGAYGESIYAVEEEWRTALASGQLSQARSGSPATTGRTEVLLAGALLLVVVFLSSVIVIIAAEHALAGLVCTFRWLLHSGTTENASGALLSQNGE